MPEQSSRIGWSLIFAAYYLYRVGCTVVGETIVAALTILGDAERYQGQDADPALEDSVLARRRFGTQLLQKFGYWLNQALAGEPLLIDTVYQTIAFIGIVKLLLTVDRKARGPLFLLFLTPSFNLWTSVASKECVVVFSLCFLMVYLIRAYRGVISINPLYLLPFLLIFWLKDQYLVPLFYLFGVTFAAMAVRQKAAVALVAGLTTLVPLILLRDLIDGMAFETQVHFIGGESTRPLFFVDTYDVFMKAPLGMYLSFVGPTILEATSSPLHMLSFIEGVALILALIFLFVRGLPSRPVYFFFLAGFTLFWMLFINYPIGVMNPGSAVRYRAGYVPLIFVLFVFLDDPRIYRDWIATHYLRVRWRRRAERGDEPA